MGDLPAKSRRSFARSIKRLSSQPFTPIMKDGIRLEIGYGDISGRFYVSAGRPRSKPPAKGHHPLTYMEWFDSLAEAQRHLASWLRRPVLRMTDMKLYERKLHQDALETLRLIIDDFMRRIVGAKKVGRETWFKKGFKLNVSVFPRVSGLLNNLDIVIRDNVRGKEYPIRVGFLDTDRKEGLLKERASLEKKMNDLLKAVWASRVAVEALHEFGKEANIRLRSGAQRFRGDR